MRIAVCQIVRVLCAIACGFCASESKGDEAWSSFQNGGQIARPVPEDFPLEWSPSEGIRWQMKLAGYGQSSPVSDGAQIYVTSISGKMKDNLHVQAFAIDTGKLLWQFDGKNSSPEESTNYVSRAAPSPVCDENGVIAMFEGGNVYALNPTGELRWQRDLVADYGLITARHGLGSSLEQNENHIFVWIEREKDPYVLALAKNSGKTAWETDGLGATTWASPRLVPVDDTRHLVLSGIGKLAGLDPNSGKRLWEFDDITGNSTPTPMPLGNGRFLIGATEGRGEEGSGNAAESNGVIQITRLADNKFAARFVWKAEKATSSFGSPIAHQGRAYFVNRAGVVYCLDLETGKQEYAQRSAGSVWATPIAAGERIYLFGRDGVTTVIKSGGEFGLLAENALWESRMSGNGAAPNQGQSFGGPVLYAAAVADSRLILRRGDVLYCISP